MPILQFDETKGFDGNLETFLEHMEKVDPEMAKILSDNIDGLKSANDDRTRREARATFNSNVVTALDKLEEPDTKNE